MIDEFCKYKKDGCYCWLLYKSKTYRGHVSCAAYTCPLINRKIASGGYYTDAELIEKYPHTTSDVINRLRMNKYPAIVPIQYLKLNISQRW